MTHVLSDLVKRLSSAGFDEVIISIEYVDRTMVKIANSQPSVAQSWSEVLIDLYLTKDKKILVTSMTTSDLDEILRETPRLLEQINSLEPSFIYAKIPEPDREVSPLTNLVKNSTMKFMEDPGVYAEILINKAHEEGGERVAGALDGYFKRRCIATSYGFEKCEDSTGFTVYARVFVRDSSGHWGYGGSGFDPRDIEEVATKATYYAKEASRAKSMNIDPGRYNVVLTPLVLGNFIDYISMALSGLGKILGTSFFAKNNPGDQIANEMFTLKDLPHRDDMMSSTAFDDEGLATRDNILIERGVLKSFIHNTKTATILETRSTANAGWIMPRPWNLRVEPGDFDEEELVREMRRGLLINNNWYTRYQNVVEGQFSTVTRDAVLVIENGEVAGSVKRVRIADSFPSLLRNIRGLGKRLYKTRWWEIRRSVELPYIMIENVNITKPE